MGKRQLHTRAFRSNFRTKPRFLINKFSSTVEEADETEQAVDELKSVVAGGDDEDHQQPRHTDKEVDPEDEKVANSLLTYYYT